MRGEELEQVFALTCTTMRVGGVQWFIVCSETATRVRDLYLLKDGEAFRSRAALKLVYQSSRIKADDRGIQRFWKIADRIGATWDDLHPPRPKYMRRHVYSIIQMKAIDAKGDALRAALNRAK